MKNIESLVAEICPSGVEFKDLGEVGELMRGNGLQKKDLLSEGVGAIHYGQVFTTYGTATSETKSFVAPSLAARLRRAKPGDLVIATTSENDEDVCKAVAWLGADEIVISGDAFVYSHTLDPLFVSYFFQSEAFQAQKRRFISGTKVKRVSAADLSRIRIPVPPLIIQREVVSTLEEMERLESEVRAELTTERQYRFRQFCYYRDFLLTSALRESVEWRSMSEVGNFFRGRRFTKADVVPDGIPSTHYGEIYTRYGAFASEALSHVRPEMTSSLRFATTGDVVIAAVGETVEDVGKAVAWLGHQDIAIHDDCFAFRHTLDPKFVAYYFQTDMFHSELDRYVSRAKMKRISSDSLGKLRIPVPPREEQERLVVILEKFDALVNDLAVELPAEVRMRRQQYRYYRDKLLTFRESA